MAAGPIFLSVILVQAQTRTGFDIARHPASLLSRGDLGWIQIANFIGAGLLVIAFAIGVRAFTRGQIGGFAGHLFVGLFGVGLLIAGLFPPDPAFGFPPGTPDGVPATMTPNSALHGLGFTLAFLSVTLACLVFARRELVARRWGWAAYDIGSAILALGFSGYPGEDGASIRYLVAAAIVWAWLAVLAVRLLTRRGPVARQAAA